MQRYMTIQYKVDLQRMMDYLYNVGYASRRQLARVVLRRMEDSTNPYDHSHLISDNLKPEAQSITYIKPSSGCKVITPAARSEGKTSYPYAERFDFNKSTSPQDHWKRYALASIVSQVYGKTRQDVLGIGVDSWNILLQTSDVQYVSGDRLRQAQAVLSTSTSDSVEIIKRKQIKDYLRFAGDMMPDGVFDFKSNQFVLAISLVTRETTDEECSRLVAFYRDNAAFSQVTLYCDSKGTAKRIMSTGVRANIIVLRGYPIMFTNQDVYAEYYTVMVDGEVVFRPVESSQLISKPVRKKRTVQKKVTVKTGTPVKSVKTKMPFVPIVKTGSVEKQVMDPVPIVKHEQEPVTQPFVNPFVKAMKITEPDQTVKCEQATEPADSPKQSEPPIRFGFYGG